MHKLNHSAVVHKDPKALLRITSPIITHNVGMTAGLWEREGRRERGGRRERERKRKRKRKREG